MSEALKRAAVLGWPVDHSLSPVIHNYLMKHYNIAGQYEKIPTEPKDLAQTLKKLADRKYIGVNLTVPHKEAAMSLMDELEPSAKIIGAVNTVTFENGKMIGGNTDAHGFSVSIEGPYKQLGHQKHKALVVGAGGAARAVLLSLSVLGFDIAIANRTLARAEALADSFPFPVRVIPMEQVEDAMADATLLVNTTTQGMVGQPPLALSLDALSPSAMVTDIVYRPLETPLLKAAKARGNPTVDGLGMLINQAIASFVRWFEVTPHETPQLRDEVERHL